MTVFQFTGRKSNRKLVPRISEHSGIWQFDVKWLNTDRISKYGPYFKMYLEFGKTSFMKVVDLWNTFPTVYYGGQTDICAKSYGHFTEEMQCSPYCKIQTVFQFMTRKLKYGQHCSGRKLQFHTIVYIRPYQFRSLFFIPSNPRTTSYSLPSSRTPR